MQIKLAPPKGYQRQPTLTPRPATYKGRGPSQSAVAMRTLYHEELQKQSLQHGIPDTWTDVASLLTQTAAKVFGSPNEHATNHGSWGDTMKF